MKRFLLTILFLEMFLFCLPVFSKDSITVTFSSNYAPLCYIDNWAHPSGYLVEYWKLWGQRNGYKINFKLVSWNSSLNLVKKGKADLHAGMFKSDERKKFFDFASELGEISAALYASTLLNADSIEDLKILPVGVVKGDYAQEYLRRVYPVIKLKIFDSNKKMFSSVSNGETLVFAFDQPQVVYYLHKNNIVGKFRFIKKLYSHKIYPAVKKGNAELLNIISQGMTKITKPEREEIFSRWIFYGKSAIDKIIKALAFIVIFSVLVFIFIHYFLLRRRVKIKTSELRKELKEKEDMQAKLVQLAMHDPLTKLPNRKLFQERLEHAVAGAKRYAYMIAVLFLDLDGFKVINDHFGHDAGDEVLKTIAERLTGTTREFDTVCRLGGDEYTIILEKINEITEIEIVADRIIEAVSKPVFFEKRELCVTTSLGISVCPSDSSESEELLKFADDAMYRAKKDGKNRYSFY